MIIKKYLSEMTRAAAAVFAVAIGARLIVLLALVLPGGESALLFGDSVRYLTLADSVLAGNGYMYDGILESFRLPGYPLFFMLLRVLHLPLILGSLIQIVIASCIAVWALWFARFKLHLSPNVSLVAGMLAALEPVQVYYSVILLPDVLFAASFLVAFTFALRWTESLRMSDAVVVGLAIGVGNFIRPAMMYYPAAIGVFFIGAMLMRRQNVRRAIVSSIVVGTVSFVIMSPWFVRNYVHFDRFSFMSMKEYTLYVYGAGSILATTRGVSFETAKQELLAKARIEAPNAELATFDNGDYYSTHARAVILAHPMVFARLYALGLGTFWTAGNYQYLFKDMGLLAPPSASVSYTLLLESQGPVAVFKVFFGRISEPFIAVALFDRLLWLAIFLVSAAGIVMYRRSPVGWLIVLTFAYFSATILSTVIGVEARHRYALNPILFGLVVAAVSAAYHGISRRIRLA